MADGGEGIDSVLQAFNVHYDEITRTNERTIDRERQFPVGRICGRLMATADEDSGRKAVPLLIFFCFFPPTSLLSSWSMRPFSANGQLRKEKLSFSLLTLTPTRVQRTRCSCLSTKLTTNDRVASASLVRSSMTNFSSMDYITST